MVIYVVHELCGAMTALSYAKREILGKYVHIPPLCALIRLRVYYYANTKHKSQPNSLARNELYNSFRSVPAIKFICVNFITSYYSASFHLHNLEHSSTILHNLPLNALLSFPS